MGGDAGLMALQGGRGGGADVIVIAEIPFTFGAV